MGNKVMREHMRERFANAKQFSEKPPLPRSLNIELNSTCNHRCVFCPFHGELSAHKVKPAVMSKEFAKQLLAKASELGIGEKEVGFYMAGEVLLYRDFPEIIAYAKELGFKYTFVTTNGAMATPKLIDELLDAGIDSLRFSVNAGDKDTYKTIHGSDDFDKVVSIIKYLDNKRKTEGYDIAVSVSSVVTKKTKSNVTKIREVFGEYVDDILFIPIILENLHQLEEVKAEWQLVEDTDKVDPNWVCAMLFNTMYINAEGKVMPCCNAYHDGVEFYDLNDDLDMEAAWNSEGYKRYRDIFIKEADDKGTACAKCILRKEGVERLSIEDLL